jgi:amino acid transporter
VAQLRRELGRWDLTAIGINQVIGAAVFAMPASVAALVGGWSPFLIVAIGLASLMIAVTFAEVGSRFDATGGPYLYTRAAFGRFPASRSDGCCGSRESQLGLGDQRPRRRPRLLLALRSPPASRARR